MSDIWMELALATSPAITIGLPLLLVWGIRGVRNFLNPDDEFGNGFRHLSENNK